MAKWYRRSTTEHVGTAVEIAGAAPERANITLSVDAGVVHPNSFKWLT